MTTDDKSELAALKARIEELEAKAKPPAEPAPFVPKPHEPIDWTARMSMPPSALLEMAQHPCNQVMGGAIHDSHAPTGRPGFIPTSQQPTGSSQGGGGGKGWIDPVPLRPPPGIAQADKLMDEQDRRDRAELARKLGK